MRCESFSRLRWLMIRRLHKQIDRLKIWEICQTFHKPRRFKWQHWQKCLR